MRRDNDNERGVRQYDDNDYQPLDDYESSEPYRQPRPKKRLGIRIITILLALVAVIGVLFGALALIFTYSAAPTLADDGDAIAVSGAGRKDGFYTFVLCGTDLGEARTDTIMLCGLDTVNRKLDFVSVPRDTMIDVSWDVKKINSSFSIGGIERLEEELKKIIGFTPDFYAVIDMDAFVKGVDAIGGVDFYVPQRMYKSDPYIDLWEGQQTLSGEQALQLVRFRDYPLGDIQRISVQQDFLKAAAAQTLSAQNIFKIKELAGIAEEYVDTDLESGNLIWLGAQLAKLSRDDITVHTLPGDSSAYYGGLSYHCLYVDKVLELVNSVLNPYVKDVSSADLDILTMMNGSLITSGELAGISSQSGGGSYTQPSAEPGGGSGYYVDIPEPEELPPSEEPSPEPEPEPSTEPLPEETPAPSEEVVIPTDEPTEDVYVDFDDEPSISEPPSEPETPAQTPAPSEPDMGEPPIIELPDTSGDEAPAETS